MRRRDQDTHHHPIQKRHDSTVLGARPKQPHGLLLDVSWDSRDICWSRYPFNMLYDNCWRACDCLWSFPCFILLWWPAHRTSAIHCPGLGLPGKAEHDSPIRSEESASHSGLKMRRSVLPGNRPPALIWTGCPFFQGFLQSSLPEEIKVRYHPSPNA